MIADDTLRWFAAHGGLTDPGDRRALFDGLPSDVAGLCRVVQGVLIHLESGAALYGTIPWAKDRPSRATLPVGVRLAAIGDLGVRPAAKRAVGTCRDFALMLCAMLRHQGIPARVRCGFAAYFEPGVWEDHWVCEYWHATEGRWAVADAQLDEAHRRHLAIDFDCSDLPSSAFRPAWEVWQAYRSGLLDPEQAGHGDTTGPWFIAVDLIRDLLSLHRREISGWDRWRDADARQRMLDDQAFARADHWARLAEGIDHLDPAARAAQHAEVTAQTLLWSA